MSQRTFHRWIGSNKFKTTGAALSAVLILGFWYGGFSTESERAVARDERPATAPDQVIEPARPRESPVNTMTSAAASTLERGPLVLEPERERDVAPRAERTRSTTTRRASAAQDTRRPEPEQDARDDKTTEIERGTSFRFAAPGHVSLSFPAPPGRAPDESRVHEMRSEDGP